MDHITECAEEMAESTEPSQSGVQRWLPSIIGVAAILLGGYATIVITGQQTSTNTDEINTLRKTVVTHAEVDDQLRDIKAAQIRIEGKLDSWMMRENSRKK